MSLTLSPPAHEVGLVSLQVAGREGPLSASVLFEYRARRFLSLPSTQLDWLSLDGKYPVWGPALEWGALLNTPGLQWPFPSSCFMLLKGQPLSLPSPPLGILEPSLSQLLACPLCPKNGTEPGQARRWEGGRGLEQCAWGSECTSLHVY